MTKIQVRKQFTTTRFLVNITIYAYHYLGVRVQCLFPDCILWGTDFWLLQSIHYCWFALQTLWVYAHSIMGISVLVIKIVLSVILWFQRWVFHPYRNQRWSYSSNLNSPSCLLFWWFAVCFLAVNHTLFGWHLWTCFRKLFKICLHDIMITERIPFPHICANVSGKAYVGIWIIYAIIHVFTNDFFGLPQFTFVFAIKFFGT